MMPDEHFDPTGVLALASALAHATRRHALPWTRLGTPEGTLHTARAAGINCHLSRSPQPPAPDRSITLTLSAVDDGRPLAIMHEAESEDARRSPLNELLRCMRLAGEETARESAGALPGHAEEVLTEILAGLI